MKQKRDCDLQRLVSESHLVSVLIPRYSNAFVFYYLTCTNLQFLLSNKSTNHSSKIIYDRTKPLCLTWKFNISTLHFAQITIRHWQASSTSQSQSLNSKNQSRTFAQRNFTIRARPSNTKSPDSRARHDMSNQNDDRGSLRFLRHPKVPQRIQDKLMFAFSAQSLEPMMVELRGACMSTITTAVAWTPDG